MLHDFKTRLAASLRDRGALAAMASILGYWVFALLYLETALHLIVFGAPTRHFAFILGFTLAYASGLALLTSFLPGKARFPVTAVLTVAIIILYGSQIVYYFVFGGLYSVSQIQQGGQAITSFLKETLLTMKNHILELLALLVPLIPLAAQRIWGKKRQAKTSALWRAAAAAVAVAAFGVSVACLPLEGRGDFTSYGFYYGSMTTTEQAARRFGLLTTFRLELLPTAATEQSPEYLLPETQPTDPDPSAEPTQPVERNVMAIDFEALNAKTEDEMLRSLNRYVSSLTGTNKNEYTGMLKDYNLIVLCAESFSAAAIDEKLTPTLYRLANEGFVFNNYYNTYPNNTTDGEYTLCMGLFPDFTRAKDASSFFNSRGNYLPFCLGNQFNSHYGIQSRGYHNYSKLYYGRGQSHPNLGYEMKFSDQGMYFTTSWPSSDLEMMQQSVKDYLTADEPFHAYYMTFSGHYIYEQDANPMVQRNWAMAYDLPYGYHGKCYMSCTYELEKAMAYLMKKLEEAGVAEKTAIVLAADHFPYGLTDKEYAELLGVEAVDEFSKAKSPLIFWVGGMEEPVQVDTYCSNVDILPTILNLWGMEYDSRLLAGTDIFSDGEHLAILRDGSFLTDKVWFHASTGETRYQVPQDQVPAGYIEGLNRLVKSKFTFSTDVLNTAYYNFVFDKELVETSDDRWR